MVYKLNTAAQQAKGREQFDSQTGINQGPRMVTIGLVRKPILMARIISCGGKVRRAANERQYSVDCAIRAFTHFNPRHGYCATSKCLRCGFLIDDTSNISIVMVALPPWGGKNTDPTKVAMMSGFFCSACDVGDDEAHTLWRATILKDHGVQLVLTDAGQS